MENKSILCLYYKSTTMERTAILQADYLDILYDHRNKNYGGYELRKHYSHRAVRATLFTLVALILIIIVNTILGKMKRQTVVSAPAPVVTNLTELKIQRPQPKLDIPKPVAPPAVKPTVKFTSPVIAPDKDVVKAPPSLTDLKDKTPGIVDAKGDPDALDPAIKKTDITGTGPVSSTHKAQIMTWVEQMPQFDGDLAAYLAGHIRYPELAKENNIEGRVVIKFVVNEDGSIAAANVERGIGGGCDEEALRVLNTMPHWKPGKQNGHPVKVYFTLPILFKLG